MSFPLMLCMSLQNAAIVVEFIHASQPGLASPDRNHELPTSARITPCFFIAAQIVLAAGVASAPQL